MDETEFFYGHVMLPSWITNETYRMPPDHGLADKQHSGVKGRKVGLTYDFTPDATSSEKLKPLIIGKAK